MKLHLNRLFGIKTLICNFYQFWLILTNLGQKLLIFTKIRFKENHYDLTNLGSAQKVTMKKNPLTIATDGGRFKNIKTGESRNIHDYSDHVNYLE